MTTIEKRISTISQHKVGSPEWLEARRSGIGASEVPAILGLDRYKSGLDLWLEKRGQAPARGDSPQARVGRHAERMIAGLFEEDTKLPLIEVPAIHHEELPILFASADRMAVEAKVDGARIGEYWRFPVEIKNRGGFPKGWGEAGTDQVPDEIALQVHVQMACYGMDEARVAVLLSGNDFRIYTIHRDRDLEASLLERIGDWWSRHIVNGEEPALSGESVDHWLRLKFTSLTGEVVKLPGNHEAVATMETLARTRSDLKKIEAYKDELEAVVKNAIGNNKGIECRAGRALWSPVAGRTTVDHQAVTLRMRDWIAEEHGAEVADTVLSNSRVIFTKTGEPSRRFTFTPAKGEE